MKTNKYWSIGGWLWLVAVMGCSRSAQETNAIPTPAWAMPQATVGANQQANPAKPAAEVLRSHHLVGKAIVVEIVRVPNGKWTNGNPPTLDVNVIDALGSDVPPGPAALSWDNPLDINCPVGEEKHIARWAAQELIPAQSNVRWRA